jgi:hypothetical protein
LGTATEFVCIPSNTGLSIGKKTSPTNALDIVGSILVSGEYKSDATNNTKIGTLALTANGTGLRNTAIGNTTLGGNITGSNNTALGFQAGRGTILQIYTNLAGIQSYRDVYADTDTGTNNTFLGADTGVSRGTSSISNSTAIGNSASLNASNQIVLGNSSITSLKCNVQTITNLSDRRDKKDIEELETGIEFIEKVKPVKFKWNMRDGGKIDILEWGFIAQDLIEIGGKQIPNLIDDSDNDKLCIGQMAMFPVLVKAVQDLKKLVDSQAKQLESQAAQLDSQAAQLERINKQLFPND